MHEKYIAVFRAHERLLIVLVVAIAGWYGWSKYLDRSVDKALASLAAAKQVAETQRDTNAIAAQKAEQQEADYKALATQTLQQNAALAAQIASRNAATEQRVQQVRVEALPLVAVRWREVASLSPDDLLVVNGALTVSDSAARSTVAELEELPTIRTNLSDMTAQYANEQRQIAACEVNTQTCEAQVTGLAQQIADDGKEYAASEKALRATARRGKLRWFQIGAGGGSIGTVILLGLVGVL